MLKAHKIAQVSIHTEGSIKTMMMYLENLKYKYGRLGYSNLRIERICTYRRRYEDDADVWEEWLVGDRTISKHEQYVGQGDKYAK